MFPSNNISRICK